MRFSAGHSQAFISVLSRPFRASVSKKSEENRNEVFGWSQPGFQDLCVQKLGTEMRFSAGHGQAFMSKKSEENRDEVFGWSMARLSSLSFRDLLIPTMSKKSEENRTEVFGWSWPGFHLCLFGTSGTCP
jgi:hypothetical protein